MITDGNDGSVSSEGSDGSWKPPDVVAGALVLVGPVVAVVLVVTDGAPLWLPVNSTTTPKRSARLGSREPLPIALPACGTKRWRQAEFDSRRNRYTWSGRRPGGPKAHSVTTADCSGHFWKPPP